MAEDLRLIERNLQNLFSWQSYSSNVSEAVLSVDCLFGWSAFDAFRLKFVATMVSPLVIVACSYLGIRAVHGSRSQFYATVILLWYLVFPSVVSKVATLFTCIPLGEVSYLVLDPEVVCWEGQHMSLSVFGIVATIVYVLGMPVSGYLGLRWSDRSSIEEQLLFTVIMWTLILPLLAIFNQRLY